VWNLAPKTSTVVLVGFLAAAAASVSCGPSGDPDTYQIVFTLTESPSDLETLHFRVAYELGEFAGTGTTVACSLVANDDDELIDSNDDDEGTLTVDIDATANPLQEGAAIVECNFLSDVQPTADNFTVTVLSADDDGGDPVADLRDIAVVVTSTSVVP